MAEFRQIWCCGCGQDTPARLTNGEEIYRRRLDLWRHPFWKCDHCGNFVGCHHRTDEPTKPLGCIPTRPIREARKAIHALIDPIWKTGIMKRKTLYRRIAEEMGIDGYHTGAIRTMDEARRVLEIAKRLNADLNP